ncbi:MAG: hypothetical protein IJU13_00925 [Bacteroidales bacterium]|nr:hypothetical protein [Bacteroidales bacterium]
MKTHNLFCMMAAVAFVAFTACQKTEIAPEDNTAPAAEVSGDATLFSASLEAPVSASTRMTIEDGAGNQKVPTWEAGDQIKIFYLDPSTSTMTSTLGTATQAGAETTFTATVPEGVTTFYAVYPATLDSSVDADGNFAVPTKASDSDEVNTFSNACICIAKCGAEKNFAFKNIVSVLKFTVAERGNVMKICSLDATPLTGTVNASLDASGNVVYAAEPYTSTAYTRVFKALPTGATNTVCYMPILPGTQAAGVAVDCKNEANLPAVFVGVSLPFERSHIYNLGTVDSKMVTDYYITASGAGTKDGKSWENAGDVNTFKSLVGIVAGDPSSDNLVKCSRYAQIWKLKGTTFHLGAGTYIFGDASNDRLTIDFYGANGSLFADFNLIGGYPAAGGQTADPASNVTAFSGNDQYGILNVFDRARVHINGVTFTGGKGTTVTASDMDIHTDYLGAALYLKQKGTGSPDKTAPRVWLTNCIFDGNKTTATSGSNYYDGGSAINQTHGAVYADHCIFRNNQDGYTDGCVRMSGQNKYDAYAAYAFFNACLFTDNSILGNNVNAGAVIMQERKGGLLGLYNCTFYNNLDGTSDQNVIHLCRAAIIANCTIVDNCKGRYPIRFRPEGHGYGNNHFILANNILLHADKTTAAVNSLAIKAPGTATATDMHLYMEGGNLFGNASGSLYTNTSFTTKTDDNEYNGYHYGQVDNPSFADNVLKWNGTLNSGALTCGFMSHDAMVNNVLKSSNINQEIDSNTKVTFETTQTSTSDKYAGFYGWLNSIGAIDKDALGNDRPATGWTPGAYQVQ